MTFLSVFLQDGGKRKTIFAHHQHKCRCYTQISILSKVCFPSTGEVLKYIDGSWQKIPDEDYFKMTKLDGQVWISLYNLLLNEESLRMFDFNSFNRDQLSKVKSQSNTETSYKLTVLPLVCTS